MKKPSRAALEFGLACLVVIGSSLLAFNTRRSDSARPHIEISGALAEYEVIGRRKSPGLRLRLAEERHDFRIDPSLFREAMHKTVPAQLRRGAPIRVLVMTEEYAQPVRPMLNDDVEIAWVHGLNVGGEKIFGLTHVEAWEQKNRRWGYALFVGALAIAGYLGVKWHRTSGNKLGN